MSEQTLEQEAVQETVQENQVEQTPVEDQFNVLDSIYRDLGVAVEEPEPVEESEEEGPQDVTDGSGRFRREAAPPADMNGEPGHIVFDPILYPNLSEDFEDGDGSFVHTEGRDYHYYATPEECDPCQEFKKRIEELEQEVWHLRKEAEH